MNLTNWRSQIRKGLIEFCLLSIIEQKGQAYGLEMLEGLAQANLTISEGTLYPLLSRLVREKYLLPKWVTPETGNPRKYYCLSEQGRKTYLEMKTEWKSINNAVERLLDDNNKSGGTRDEQPEGPTATQ